LATKGRASKEYIKPEYNSMILNYFHMVGWWFVAISKRKKTTKKDSVPDR
jgi:hypothetical protein